MCAPSIGGESFGIILLEAMATGTPLVATNIPGYAGVMTHEHDGLMVPPASSQAIALAVVRLLADQQLRQCLSDNGMRTANTYAWPKVAKAVIAMYEQALRAAGTAKWRQE